MLQHFDGAERAERFTDRQPVGYLGKQLLQALAGFWRRFASQSFAQRGDGSLPDFLQLVVGLLPGCKLVTVEIGNQLGDSLRVRVRFGAEVALENRNSLFGRS